MTVGFQCWQACEREKKKLASFAWHLTASKIPKTSPGVKELNPMQLIESCGFDFCIRLLLSQILLLQIF